MPSQSISSALILLQVIFYYREELSTPDKWVETEGGDNTPL